MTTIKIHDHGFVRLVDSFGGDDRVVESARVSYSGKKKRSDSDLIDYLVRHKHTSPLEQVVFTFHLKMPIFVARQWMRHRMARINEISARYVEIPEEIFIPIESQLGSQLGKQGRNQKIDSKSQIIQEINSSVKSSFQTYKNLLELGLARELARIVLPVATYTEFYWQIDLRNLMQFLVLRTDVHSQQEMQDYAVAVLELARPIAPQCFSAWETHQKGSVTFSKDELDLISSCIDPGALHTRLAHVELRQSRKQELLDKLHRLGLEVS